MNTEKFTVALVCLMDGSFSDELVLSAQSMPLAKMRAGRWCKSHNIKILRKRDDFGYPSISTKTDVTWLVTGNLASYL